MPLVVQCPACRILVGVSEVAIPLDGSRAGLRCGACGATTWLPASNAVDAQAHDAPTQARVQPAPALPPAMALVPRAEAPAAPAAPSFAAHGPRLTEEQRTLVAEQLKRLAPADDEQRRVAVEFSRLLEAWEDAGAHKALLQRASASGALAFAGQSYRAVLDAIPGEPAAKRAQAEILGLAMASLSSTREIGKVEGKATPRVASLVMIGIAVALLVVVMTFILPRLLRPGADEATMGNEAGAVPAQE